MQKIYLLLRNNKQSGPHTLDEIRQLQLKPLDLVWVEGRSTAWAYPSEIEALQPHVSTSSTLQESGYPAADSSLVLPRTQPTPPSTPIKKVYVKLPEDYKKTNKADAEKTRVQEEIIEDGTETDEQGLNIKYSQTLDDIREQYSEWMYKQKTSKKNPIPFKYVKIALIALSIVMACFLIVHSIIGRKANDEQIAITAATEKVPVVKEAKKPGKKKSNNSKDKKKKVVPIVKETEEILQEENLETQKLPIPPAVDLPKPVSHETSLFTQVQIHYNYDSTNHTGISGLRFTLKNSSEVKLNTVGLDVYYQFTGNHAPTKKTIYFNNILPHATMTANAPDNEQAISVTFKLAFISTDETIHYGKE